MGKRGSFKDSVNATSPAAELLKKSETAAESKAAPKTETKTARVNLLFRPSLKQNLEKLAQMKRTSFNDLMNTMAAEYVEAHQDEIDKFNEFFGED